MVVSGYILTAYIFDGWNSNVGSFWMSRTTIKPNWIEQDKRIEIRRFVKDFMMDKVGYCCTDSYKQDGLNKSNKDSFKYIFNENEFYELETTKDFENWIYEQVTK